MHKYCRFISLSLFRLLLNFKEPSFPNQKQKHDFFSSFLNLCEIGNKHSKRRRSFCFFFFSIYMIEKFRFEYFRSFFLINRKSYVYIRNEMFDEKEKKEILRRDEKLPIIECSISDLSSSTNSNVKTSVLIKLGCNKCV